MANCPTIDPEIGTAQTLIQSVNCYVETSVANSYGALMGPGGGLKGALTAALVIYVAVLGYRFMLGRSQLSMGDLVPRMLLIGALLALTTSWATYQTLVYNVLTDGPEEITQMVTRGQTPNRNVAERVDIVSKRLTDVANIWGKGAQGIVGPIAPQSSIAQAANAARARSEAAGTNPLPTTTATATATTPATISGNPFSSAPNYLSWSAMLLTLTAAGSIAITKALLGLLLALGPAFALFALFNSTRGLAVGWARAALFLAFVPLLATLTSLAMLAMLEPMALRLANDAARGVFSLNSALAIFIAVLVMTGIALLAVRVAGMMVSGWVINLKEHLGDRSRGNADAAFAQTPLNADTTTQARIAATNQPRVDQMVQAIERSNAHSTIQSLQRIDTRMLDIGSQQPRRAADGPAAGRISGLLQASKPSPILSPLRPARSW
jgi:type IV secretion system protein VirB6